MGKLNYESHIQHFSHEHPLHLTNILQQQQPPNITICSGCKVTASPDQWIYTCKSCNFNLHIPCSQMPKFINHPCDPNHPLILLPSPGYTGGLFNCDACGRQENTGFSYHCTACNIDLHIHCATKPPSVNHQSHPHPLSLTFDPPYEPQGFSCDICHKPGLNHWLYRCDTCGFDAHIDCATANNGTNNPGVFIQQTQPQPTLQHHHLFPGASNHQPQFMPQGVVHQGIPMINNNNTVPPQQQRDYKQQTFTQLMQPYLQQLEQRQQSANNIFQTILGRGNNSGGGIGTNDIVQSILGGGGLGASYNQLMQQQLQQLDQHQQHTSDIFQSILEGGNNGGGVGSNGIVQSILAGGNNGGGTGSSSSSSVGDSGGGVTNPNVHSIFGGGGGGGFSTSYLENVASSIHTMGLIG